MLKPVDSQERTGTQLQNQWKTVNNAVQRFQAHQEFCNRNKESGKTEAEVIEDTIL